MTVNLKKGFFVATGSLCLTLGIVGIFVPLLPTTPFLLLAAACFFRGSDRLYSWLVNHRWFGNYIRYYRQYRAVSLRAKIMSIAVLWLFIGFAVVFITHLMWLRLLVVVIALGVSGYLIRLRTLTKEMVTSARERCGAQTPAE